MALKTVLEMLLQNARLPVHGLTYYDTKISHKILIKQEIHLPTDADRPIVLMAKLNLHPN